MAKRGRQLKTKRSKPRLPGVTEDGFLDPAQFPIDPVLKQALSDDRQEFHSAVSLLRSMYNYERKEAGVFLLGLLPGFEKLVADKSLTPRMRAKFQAIRDDLAYRQQHGYR